MITVSAKANDGQIMVHAERRRVFTPASPPRMCSSECRRGLHMTPAFVLARQANMVCVKQMRIVIDPTQRHAGDAVIG